MRQVYVSCVPFAQVWAHCLEATAINHFIGSGSFARALRFWARFHIAPHAAAQCEHDDKGEAVGFKLSELVRRLRCWWLFN